MKTDETNHLSQWLIALSSALVGILATTLPNDLYGGLSAIGYKWLFLVLLTLLLALLNLSILYFKNVYKGHLQLKQWEKTKSKYLLEEIAPGIKVYIPHKPEDRIGNTHWLCTNCFNIHNVESIYQLKNSGYVSSHIYYCPNCESTITIENKDYQDPFSGINLQHDIYK